MNKKIFGFIFSKLLASASIALGIHFLVAHFNKVLPFSIQCDNIGIWFIWAYTGPFIGFAIMAYGICLLFKRTISRYIRSLER